MSSVELKLVTATQQISIKSGSKGGAIEDKDEVIKVAINLDGKIQTIDLIKTYCYKWCW